MDNKTDLSLSVASPLTYESLMAAGLMTKKEADKVSRDVVEKARSLITQDGGSIPTDASDALIIAASRILVNAKQAAKAGRAASLYLALIDDSEEYKRVKDAYGNNFKNMGAFCKVLFPSLADSTLRNYLNVGKAIYLPAKRGTLDADLMALNDLEPGTALFAVGALNDDKVRAELPAILKSAISKNRGKLSQSVLKSAVKEAKETAGKPKRDTTLTANSDAKNAHKAEVETLRAAIAKAFAVDKSADELHLSLDLTDDESGMKVMNKLLNDAAKDGESASLFVESFTAFLKAYSK